MIKRLRPVKEFRVLKAYGPFLKDDVIQPTGIYRDRLLALGLIEEIKENKITTRGGKIKVKLDESLSDS